MIEVVGDVVTLAEVCAETIVAPWVIENEVTLTYPATVTISPAILGTATFPVKAVSWQLEAKVDGAVVLRSVTGRSTRGSDLSPIRWCDGDGAVRGTADPVERVMFSDAAGAQVGTGVSAQLTNDDPTNPPSTVAFAIKKIAGDDRRHDGVQADGHHRL